jgi:hypothetical protein
MKKDKTLRTLLAAEKKHTIQPLEAGGTVCWVANKNLVTIVRLSQGLLD